MTRRPSRPRQLRPRSRRDPAELRRPVAFRRNSKPNGVGHTQVAQKGICSSTGSIRRFAGTSSERSLRHRASLSFHATYAPFVFILLTHSFALREMLTPLFSSTPTLFA